MYLKELTLKGFKSFANKTTLRFEPGVTIIVGPNGSGKSNIADAVMWVLGEQSPSTLRGLRMEDVIFAGSDGRKPENFAEVQMLIDNSTNEFPLSFSEIRISRNVIRGGESEYCLNNTPCRLSDIQELLSDVGIGKTLNSVVSQGQLDEILSCKPEERRRFIEEAGGLLKFRRRREKAERKLWRTEDEILRLKDVIREVRRQIRPLKLQAERLEKYHELDARLREAGLKVLVSKFNSLKSKLREREEVLGKKREAIDSVRAEIDRKVTDLEGTERRIREWRSREESLRNAIFKLVAVNERLKAAGERWSITEVEKLISIMESVPDFAEEERRLKERLAFLEIEESGLSVRKQMLVSSVRRLALELEEAQRRVRDAMVERANLRGRLDFLKSRVSQLELSGKGRDSVEAVSIGDLHLEEQALSRRLEVLKSKSSELEREIQEALDGLSSLRNRRDEVVRELRDRESRVASLLSKLEIIAELDSSSLGHAKAASVLEKNDPTEGGLSGILASELEIEPGFERAITGYLGPWLFGRAALSSDSLEDAIFYLKKTGSGQGLFFRYSKDPSVDAFHHPGPRPPSLREAREVVRAPEHFSDALDALLGGVYLVEDLKSAFRYAEQYPHLVFLSPDADVITGGTLLKGGSIEAGRAPLEILNQSRLKMEDLLERYVDEVNRMELELDALIKRESEIHALLEGRCRELLANLSEQEEVISRIADLRVEIGVSGGGLAAGAGEISSEEDTSRLEALCLSLEEQISQEESRIAAARSEQSAASEDLDALNGELERIDAEKRLIAEKLESFKSASSLMMPEDVGNLGRLSRRYCSLLGSLSGLAARKKEELSGLLDRGGMDVDKDFKIMYELKKALNDLRSREEELRESYHAVEVDAERIRFNVEQIASRITDDHDMSVGDALERYSCEQPLEDLERQLESLRLEVERLGPVNPVAASDMEALKERHDFLTEQLKDLERGRSNLRRVISEVDKEIRDKFRETFEEVDRNFREIFALLFPGGNARLRLTEPEDPLNTGVEIYAQPEGKRLRRVSLLSGGETALTSIAFLFAIFRVRPSPFYFLDEVEAALDDINLNRFIKLVGEFKERSQLIIITHQKRTMEIADVLHGVSMQGDGISKVISHRISADVWEKEGDITRSVRA